MTPNHNKLRFPLWLYLNQPIFSPTYKTVLNPLKYWNVHRIQHLERCWIKEYRPEEHLN